MNDSKASHTKLLLHGKKIQAAISVLNFPDVDTKKHAIKRLSDCSKVNLPENMKKQVIEALLRACADKDVVYEATGALFRWILSPLPYECYRSIIEGLLQIFEHKSPHARQVITGLWSPYEESVKNLFLTPIFKHDKLKILEALIQSLEDKVKIVRLTAASSLESWSQVSLPETSKARVIDTLLKALVDTSPSVRKQVIIALGSWAQPALPEETTVKVIDALINALKGNHANIKKQSIIALGSWAEIPLLEDTTIKLIDALMRAVSDKNFDIKKQAIIALGSCAQANLPENIQESVMDVLLHASKFSYRAFKDNVANESLSKWSMADMSLSLATTIIHKLLEKKDLDVLRHWYKRYHDDLPRSLLKKVQACLAKPLSLVIEQSIIQAVNTGKTEQIIANFDATKIQELTRDIEFNDRSAEYKLAMIQVIDAMDTKFSSSSYEYMLLMQAKETFMDQLLSKRALDLLQNKKSIKKDVLILFKHWSQALTLTCDSYVKNATLHQLFNITHHLYLKSKVHSMGEQEFSINQLKSLFNDPEITKEHYDIMASWSIWGISLSFQIRVIRGLLDIIGKNNLEEKVIIHAITILQYYADVGLPQDLEEEIVQALLDYLDDKRSSISHYLYKGHSVILSIYKALEARSKVLLSENYQTKIMDILLNDLIEVPSPREKQYAVEALSAYFKYGFTEERKKQMTQIFLRVLSDETNKVDAKTSRTPLADNVQYMVLSIIQAICALHQPSLPVDHQAFVTLQAIAVLENGKNQSVKEKAISCLGDLSQVILLTNDQIQIIEALLSILIDKQGDLGQYAALALGKWYKEELPEDIQHKIIFWLSNSMENNHRDLSAIEYRIDALFTCLEAEMTDKHLMLVMTRLIQLFQRMDLAQAFEKKIRVYRTDHPWVKIQFPLSNEQSKLTEVKSGTVSWSIIYRTLSILSTWIKIRLPYERLKKVLEILLEKLSIIYHVHLKETAKTTLLAWMKQKIEKEITCETVNALLLDLTNPWNDRDRKNLAACKLEAISDLGLSEAFLVHQLLWEQTMALELPEWFQKKLIDALVKFKSDDEKLMILSTQTLGKCLDKTLSKDLQVKTKDRLNSLAKDHESRKVRELAQKCLESVERSQAVTKEPCSQPTVTTGISSPVKACDLPSSVAMPVTRESLVTPEGGASKDIHP